MTPNLRELARVGVQTRLTELAAERDALLEMFPELRESARTARKAVAAGPPIAEPLVRRRPPMSAAQKRAVGERMKKYWAAKRAEKSKGGALVPADTAHVPSRKALRRQSRKK